MSRQSQDIDLQVGQRMARLRQVRGMSQTGLADSLGISFQQVQKYEKGTNRISASRLYDMAQVLGCAVGDLFPPADLPGSDRVSVDPVVMAPEGQVLLSAYGRIADASVRQALTHVALALAKA